MQDKSKRILVGRITGIYGIKGWVKIESYTRPPENIFSYQPWFIKQESDWREIRLLDSKKSGKGLIGLLDQINDRDTARELIGADISIFRSQLQELKPGEYYWNDLLGMQVIDQKNNNLGQLKEIAETGANDVLIVEGNGRHLIPLIWGRYVLEVDQENGNIRVDWEDPE